MEPSIFDNLSAAIALAEHAKSLLVALLDNDRPGMIGPERRAEFQRAIMDLHRGNNRLGLAQGYIMAAYKQCAAYIKNSAEHCPATQRRHAGLTLNCTLAPGHDGPHNDGTGQVWENHQEGEEHA